MHIEHEHHIRLKAFERVDCRVLNGVAVHAAFVVQRLDEKPSDLRGVGEATLSLGRVEH